MRIGFFVLRTSHPSSIIGNQELGACFVVTLLSSHHQQCQVEVQNTNALPIPINTPDLLDRFPVRNVSIRHSSPSDHNWRTYSRHGKKCKNLVCNDLFPCYMLRYAETRSPRKGTKVWYLLPSLACTMKLWGAACRSHRKFVPV